MFELLNVLPILISGLAYASKNEANIHIYLHLQDDEDADYASSKLLIKPPVLIEICFSSLSS